MRNSFKHFKASPEIIRLTEMMYVRFPLSLRQVEDLLNERGIDISYETIRAWWNRLGTMFAADIRKKRASQMRFHMQWRWRLDEVFVRIGGEDHYLWRAVNHEGEVLESYVTKPQDDLNQVRRQESGGLKWAIKNPKLQAMLASPCGPLKGAHPSWARRPIPMT